MKVFIGSYPLRFTVFPSDHLCYYVRNRITKINLYNLDKQKQIEEKLIKEMLKK